MKEENKIGPPVIFDIAYTPYKMKSNATEIEIDKHRKERAFYDMSGDDNIYKYITTEGKLIGEETARFTMLQYLQKSTGVFNADGMLTKTQVKEMRKRAQTGEKNIWHGFISLDEEHSEQIDNPDKCIRLIKQNFGEFFRDVGFDEDNIDLMCALHLDRPTHLHIHFVFWEKEPRIKNKRAAGYIYRKKGKIPLEHIENMTKRLNDYVIAGNGRRESSGIVITDNTAYDKAFTRDYIRKEMRRIASELTESEYSFASLSDQHKREVEDMAVCLINYNEDTGKLHAHYKDDVRRLQDALKSKMGKIYDLRLKREQEFIGTDFIPPSKRGVESVHIFERLCWFYQKGLGDIVVDHLLGIKEQTYTYDKKRKYSVNNKTIKRRSVISNRKISRLFDGLFDSVFELFNPPLTALHNRLHEIEAEIEADHEREKKTLNKEDEANAVEVKRKRNYNEGK